ncbi:hypothetical protein GDO81_020638, partial [Engystomops pustulosus]
RDDVTGRGGRYKSRSLIDIRSLCGFSFNPEPSAGGCADSGRLSAWRSSGASAGVICPSMDLCRADDVTQTSRLRGEHLIEVSVFSPPASHLEQQNVS